MPDMRLNVASNVINAITRTWKSWKHRQESAAELAGCGSAEIDRIAADVGLTSVELERLALCDEDSADLLRQRLAASGIVQNSIGGAVMRDMQRCCSTCDSKPECAQELRRPERPARWPSYCPNAETLMALTATNRH